MVLHGCIFPSGLILCGPGSSVGVSHLELLVCIGWEVTGALSPWMLFAVGQCLWGTGNGPLHGNSPRICQAGIVRSTEQLLPLLHKGNFPPLFVGDAHSIEMIGILES